MFQYPYLPNIGYNPTVYFVYVPQKSDFLSETNLNLGYYHVTVIDATVIPSVYSFSITLPSNSHWFQIIYDNSTNSYTYQLTTELKQIISAPPVQKIQEGNQTVEQLVIFNELSSYIIHI